MPVREEESFCVTPQVFVEHAVTEVELNGLINTAFHGQHRVVAGVENLVRPLVFMKCTTSGGRYFGE